MREKMRKLPKVVVVVIGFLMVAGFLLVMNVAALLAAKVPAFYDGYQLQLIAEFVAAIYLVLLLFLFGYRKVLKEKGIGFLKGFYIGGFMTGYCFFALVAQMYVQQMTAEKELQPIGLVVAFIATMLLVGFNEEIVVRGIVLNLFLDRFEKSKKGVLAAILLSSLIFGCAHLPNIIAGASVMGVVVQTVQATLLGVLFATIYLRTQNIWITIIIHAATDFAALFGSGIFGTGSMVDGIDNLSLINLVVTVPLFLVPCIVLLRKAGMEEILNLRNGVETVLTDMQAEHMATTSLILGILGISFGCAGYGISFSVVGLLGACWSKKEKPFENGVATAGMITSIAGLAIAVAAVIVMMFLLPMLGDMADLQSLYGM